MRFVGPVASRMPPGDLAYAAMGERTEAPGKGTLVAGKYRLERLLGRGGMGSVWEGVHTSLGTQVAVKFIEAEFANHPEIRDRFFNEAFAAARLQSKHIVQVYDHGVDDAGRPYIVMEFLSGEALEERLVREGTLSLADAVSVIRQVARAVKKAHQNGIIHRDLKPENIFLVWDEEDKRDLVKVVDFGIAKFMEGSGISSATRTGAVLGTPHFMSPEQARGLKDVDARADVWSIGVVAYRAITGALPFDGEAVGDLLVNICTVEPTPPSEHVPVPPKFDDWMRRALSKDVEQRFASVDEQARALSDIAADSQQAASGTALEPALVSADTALSVERAARAPGRAMSPMALAAAIGVIAIAGSVGAWIASGAQSGSGTDAAAAEPELGGTSNPLLALPSRSDEGSTVGATPSADSEDNTPSVAPAQPSSDKQDEGTESSDEQAAGGSGASEERAPAAKPPAARPKSITRPALRPKPKPAPRSPSDELGY